jgi:hypothetical protein
MTATTKATATTMAPMAPSEIEWEDDVFVVYFIKKILEREKIPILFP